VNIILEFWKFFLVNSVPKAPTLFCRNIFQLLKNIVFFAPIWDRNIFQLLKNIVFFAPIWGRNNFQ
jgi:hypothetical protein